MNNSEKLKKIRGEKSENTTMNAYNEFDKNNLIILCYPRSRFIMNIFKEKIKKFEEK